VFTFIATMCASYLVSGNRERRLRGERLRNTFRRRRFRCSQRSMGVSRVGVVGELVSGEPGPIELCE
jgi:hypothetical protein